MESMSWVRVSTLNEIVQVLATCRTGTLRVNGRIMRVRLSDRRNVLFIPAPGKRVFGHYVSSWPREWGNSVEVRSDPVRSRIEQVVQNLRLRARYILQYTPPGVWEDLRETALAVTEDRLHDLIVLDPDPDHLDGIVKLLGLPHTPEWLGRHRTTTLRSQGAPARIMNEVHEAFAQRRQFEVGWQARYHCSASGRIGSDGVYRASLATEYREHGNGHYWAILDGFRAILLGSD